MKMHRRPWSPAELQTAAAMRQQGHSFVTIGKHLDRPWKAVETRLAWERMSADERADWQHRHNAQRRERRAARYAPPPRRHWREVVSWQGRCPAFRPLDERDEKRGRMAHHAD